MGINNHPLRPQAQPLIDKPSWAARLLPRQGSLSRMLLAVVAGALVLLFFRWSLGFLRAADAHPALTMLVALLTGILGVWSLYAIANDLIAQIPSERLQERLRPLMFVGPAVALLLIYLVYPMLSTIYLSLFDKRSTSFIGLANYAQIFQQPDLKQILGNNLLWIVCVTSLSLGLGLLIAVLIDKVRYEAVAKSLIFLPMAISFVGASVIWRFVYAFQPANRPQIGLLNALVVGFGGEPQGWLINQSVNNFALIAIMIWLQTGFALVILSAALKAIPADVIDAARIDGASETQIFFAIVIPFLRPTIVAVGTTVLIAVLKVFDIVYVMTSGQHGTEVIANRMYAEMFKNRNTGLGSALAVILFLAVVPVMVANVRSLRKQRG